MLNFLILNDKDFNYKQLFLDVDSKILDISKKSLYNAKYGLLEKIDYNSVSKLQTYKSILALKLCDNDIFCNVDLDIIKSKIQQLINKNGFKRPKNNLTGCLPGECSPINNININFR